MDEEEEDEEFQSQDLLGLLSNLEEEDRLCSEQIVRAVRFYDRVSQQAAANSPIPVKRQQFLGGVADDDTRMLRFIDDLEHRIEEVKREKKLRETRKDLIEGPWIYDETLSSVAACRFHRWGEAEALAYFERQIATHVETREKVWHAYRIDFIVPSAASPSSKPVAWFVGATNYLKDDMILVLTKMVTGEAPRRITETEGVSEFSKFTLLLQVGHAWFRHYHSLEFVRFSVMKEASNKLNQIRVVTSKREYYQIERDAIEESQSWFTSLDVIKGKGGLNYYDPFTCQIHARWGISLSYLRTVLDRNDTRSRFWTFQEVFERTLQPRIRTKGSSFIDFLRAEKPECVNEQVDWFLSPSCHDCIWVKLVFDGGISLYARDPEPIIKGDRFVYCDLFMKCI